MNVKGGWSEGELIGGGKGKHGHCGEKRMEICYMNVFKISIIKTTKHCKNGVKKKRGIGYSGRVNVFKVHCTRVWKYNETPTYY
jgi:hypothetical protein